MTRQPPKLASARAYYRLAAKEEKAALDARWPQTNYRTAERYRKIADQLVEQNRVDQERRAKR